MSPMVYHIELVGGPDDGAVYECKRLPEVWEIVKEIEEVICALAQLSESHFVVRYYRSDEVTEHGRVLYYHQDYEGLLAAVA
ncbi:MAG: hypothetical protein AAF682_32045 [Planctomycetota bacterium]